MNTLKRIFVGIIIAIIILCAVFYSYSAIENGAVVFATNQDGTLNNDELDIGISSWLESHGGNIFSPQNYRARKTYEAGLIHNFIYGDGGGYDAVRNHIKGSVGGNNELRFDFDAFIIQKLNTWLNNKLQNGEFGEGVELNENGMFDDGIDNNLYSGTLFTDLDGNSCLVYYINNTSKKYENNNGKNLVTKYGTPYKYSADKINDIYKATYPNNYSDKGSITDYIELTYNLNSEYSKSKKYYLWRSVDWWWLSDYQTESYSANPSYYYRISAFRNIKVDNVNTAGEKTCEGNPCIIMLNDGKLYFGTISFDSVSVNRLGYICIHDLSEDISTNITPNINIIFTTNNNNNIVVYPDIDADGTVYITPKVNVGVDGEVNYQPYIINEGDIINNVINQYYIDSNTPDKTISYPSDNPHDNGGGNDNPSGGTPPDWSNNYPHLSPDGEGGFNFNFTLPDLNIDWNISGLSEKFPFSIPFDLMAFCQILDAEPETPRFEGDLVLPMLTYHIDLNLERFNTIAQLLRNLEFVGFCIGLILITRSMIKG